MLGDLRVLDAGDELLLDTERVRPAGAVQHDPALQARARRRAAQAHAGDRAALADRARRAPRSPAPTGCRTRSTPRGAPRSAGTRCGWSPPTLGVDVLCAAEDTEGVRGALDAAGAVAVDRRGGRGAAGSSPGARATALDLDDAVIPQEAGLNERAVSFTKGCYVGPGDGRAAATTAASRTATCAACGSPSRPSPARALQLGEREVGTRRLRGALAAPGPDRPGASCAARPSRARR